jgi:queuine tRNA-ribosyltransferase
MGVGTPLNIIEGVHRGIDFFDCVMPSRNARHGNLFTWGGKMNLLNEKYAEDSRPIDEACGCPACRKHSRSYIRHLIKAEEILSGTLITMHNIRFSVQLMADIRRAIAEDRFGDFARELLEVKLF